MNPILKKISIFASLAAVPAFFVGDIVFVSRTINSMDNFIQAKNEVVAEYRLTDNFNIARSKKENEYYVLYDEDKITEKEFRKYLKDLDSDTFAESQLLENGTEGEKIRYNSANSKIEEYSRKTGLVAAGLVAGNAITAFALAMGIKTLKDEEKKKKADSEDDKQI